MSAVATHLRNKVLSWPARAQDEVKQHVGHHSVPSSGSQLCQSPIHPSSQNPFTQETTAIPTRTAKVPSGRRLTFSLLSPTPHLHHASPPSHRRQGRAQGGDNHQPGEGAARSRSGPGTHGSSSGQGARILATQQRMPHCNPTQAVYHTLPGLPTMESLSLSRPQVPYWTRRKAVAGWDGSQRVGGISSAQATSRCPSS